jgi:hypothetical protein
MVLTLEQTTNRPLVDLIPDDGRPDLARVLSMEAQATDYFRGFHKQCEEEDEYYFGTKKIPVPEGMNIDPVRPATAFAIVNIATDHVDVNNLAIDVPLMPRSRARAEKLKKYYQGVWLSIKKPVLRTSVRHAFQYGLGWLSPRYLPNLYPDAPLRSTYDTEEQYKEALGDFQEKRRIAFPLDCLNINPKNMLWDDSRTGPRWKFSSPFTPCWTPRRGSQRRWRPFFASTPGRLSTSAPRRAGRPPRTAPTTTTSSAARTC